MDRGAWWATLHGVTKSQTQLSDFHFHTIRNFFKKVNKNIKSEDTGRY